MDMNDFMVDFPELYAMIDEDVNNALTANQINKEASLEDWDNMIDSIVQRYDLENAYGYNNDLMMNQFHDGFRDGRNFYRDRDWYFRNRRRFRNSDVRDIVRLAFLRRLFDRGRF